MTLEKLNDFIRSAKKGRKLVYGRSAGSTVPDEKIMRAAYRAYEAGKITLVQKRTGDIKKLDGKFDYIAVKK